MEFLGLKCEFCGSTALIYRPMDTFNNYEQFDTEVIDIKKVINDPNNNYLIFKCMMCEALIKYTFKDIEKNIKNGIYEYIVGSIARDQYKNISSIETTKKFFIYCGKCKGWDGKGSCPVEVFDKCELKRIPI